MHGNFSCKIHARTQEQRDSLGRGGSGASSVLEGKLILMKLGQHGILCGVMCRGANEFSCNEQFRLTSWPF